jgi:hypothetical protein
MPGDVYNATIIVQKHEQNSTLQSYVRNQKDGEYIWEEGVLCEDFQRKYIDFWYNDQRVLNDINNGVNSYIASCNSQVIGVIGGG